ncbi:MAG TPA: nucleotidyltransferase family protein [Ktedonobacterales bacterium]|nr:nucleotidyltransferase family protein [Ktedonobacterales bacterium]
MMQPAIAAIILGAGASSRMGEHKLLLPLGDKPLIAWSVAAACASSARPVVVTLGRAAEVVAGAITAALPGASYSVVVNQRFAQGMGTSLALAVASLPAGVVGAVVLLGDQPFMSSAVIEAVLTAARAQPERLAMGGYGKRRGHPVYLPRRVFPELLALGDDEGARAIIARAADDLTLVALADDTPLLDVDTPEDYQRAQALAERLAQSAENTPS